ncbi:MAG: rhodanese-like domain-containing protein [Actinomycetes bacterium]
MLVSWGAADIDSALSDAVLLLDVRSASEHSHGHLPNSLLIPHTQLRDRIAEVESAAAGRPIRVYCASGFRSYLAHRVLAGHGLDSATLDGGLETLRAALPGLPMAIGVQSKVSSH